MIFLFENECPLDSNTFETAFYNNNLNNMIFLYENGCPWDSNTFRNAILYKNFDNNLEITMWLEKNLHSYL
jgi:hypothetical protein